MGWFDDTVILIALVFAGLWGLAWIGSRNQ
jgi:hypothetical protein